jgi:hypothetical protein
MRLFFFLPVLFFFLATSSSYSEAATPFVDTTLGGRWACPGACWSLLDIASHVLRAVDGLRDFWAVNCSYCAPCTYGQCYGRECVNGGTDVGCYGCDTGGALRRAYRTFRPTQLATCKDLTGQTMCLKGYYDASGTASAAPDVPCVPCLSANLVESCRDGFHPSRCATSDATACVPCTYPPLEDGQAYGSGTLYEDCDALLDVNTVDISDCAFFQTPKWEAGYCAVHCVSGYAPRSTGGCARCQTECAAGSYPPTCPGGPGAPINGDECVTCDPAGLPDDAFWLADRADLHCGWACRQGFYALNGRCVACELTMGVCDADAHSYWLGCGVNSPGECRSCASVNCQEHITFRVGRPYENACRCQRCGTATYGVTYVVATCTPRSDMVLGACSAEASCTTGKYQSEPCTLWSDRTCALCTPPVLGKRLLAPCNASHDAQYGACPPGMGCDGSATPFACVWPRTASADGRCVCLPARAEPDCAPMPCDAGYFPDNRTGSCMSCAPYMWDAGLTPQSRSGVLMGPEACGCPRGYLQTWRGARFDCWPCGDLGCVPDVEQQTACRGFDATDPTCECAIGPGMRRLPSNASTTPCAMACAEGFAEKTALVPSLYYGDQGFLSAATAHYAARLTPGEPPCPSSAQQQQQQAALLGQGQFVLWLLCGGQRMRLVTVPPFASNATLIITEKEARVTTLSAEAVLSIEGISANVQPLDVMRAGPATFDGEEGLWAWLFFRFWGMCDADLVEQGPLGATVRWCVAVDLVTAERCPQGACLFRGSNRWGKTFPLGVVGEGGALAVSDDGATLFLWRPSIGLHRYGVVLYAGETPYEARADDPLIAMDAGPKEGVRSMAHHMGTLYLLLERTTTTTTGEVRALRLLGDDASSVVVAAQAPPSMPFHDDVRLRGWMRLTLSSPRAGLYVWDAPNGALSSPFFLHDEDDVPLWFAVARLPRSSPSSSTVTTGLIGLNATHLLLKAGVRECPWDTFASSASNGACVRMPCTRAAMCDAAHGVRAHGNTSCECAAGFHLASADTCAPCAPPYFCVGGSAAPTPCPSGSAVTLEAGARSSADCVCVPGTFRMGAQQCLECPNSMWCPVHGTLAPVECVGRGWTIAYGAQTPLECRCPSRTYGLACTPCAAHMDCTTVNRTLVSALRVTASGGLDGEARLVACIGLEAVHYSLLGVALTTLQRAASPSSTLNDELLWWDWAVVLPAYARGAAVACLASNFVHVDASAMAADVLLPVGVAGSCGGRHMEWTDAGCACVAGYEAVNLGGVGGVQCLPCLNGTFRAPSSGSGCMPCPHPSLHAPFLGMTACVCLPDYDADRTTGSCVPIAHDDPRRAPPWLPSSLMTVVWMGAAAGAAAMGFACAFGCLVSARLSSS